MDQRDLRNRLLSAQGHMGAVAEMTKVTSVIERGAMNAIHRELWHVYLLDGNCGLRARNKSRRAKE